MVHSAKYTSILYDSYTIATSINDNNDDYDGDYYHLAHNNMDNG